MAPEILEVLSQADLALGRLEGATSVLPNPDLFVRMYVRQEAVLSSQIEGTQASLVDLLDFEVGQQDALIPKDVEEVINYVRATNFGLRRLSDLPMSLRLIREIHSELVKGVKAQERSPGEFRRTQNWIGPAGGTLMTATFVPPPPTEMNEALSNLEEFLHHQAYPPLIRAGITHAQFETIHPFLDGNGRVGRLLITILLCERGILTRPLLYLSHYLKLHRPEYYDRLQAIRTDGHWEQWLLFFLRGVWEVADQAAQTARQILALREDHRGILSKHGKASGNLLRGLDMLFQQPIVTIHFLADQLGLTYAGANNLARRLLKSGILVESTGYQRNRRFVYAPYLSLFREVATRPSAADEKTMEQTVDLPGDQPAQPAKFQ